MSEKIKFTFAEISEISIKEGNRYKKLRKDERLKNLVPIFDAIDKTGTKEGKVDGQEIILLKWLSEKLGDNITPERIEEVVKEFQESGKSIQEFLNPESVNEEKISLDTHKNDKTEEVTTPEDNRPASGTEKPEKEKEILSEDGKTSQKAFNQAIQVMVTSRGVQKETLEKEFTQVHEVVKGDSLYKIALKTLKDEGVDNPGWKEINARIAEIALVNGIKDVNLIRLGEKLKVGRKTGDPGHPAKDTGAPISVGESSIKIAEDFNPEGWTKTEVDGEEGVIKYTRTTGEGENTLAEEKYLTKSGSAVLVSETLQGLKDKKEAFEALQTVSAKPDETPEAAAHRKTENLDKLKLQVNLNLTGEALADIVSQLKDGNLVDKNSAETKALINEMLKTLNPAVVRAVILDESGTFDRTVFEKDLMAFETMTALFKSIRDKEMRGEMLSDTEHELKSVLKKTANIGAFKIEAVTEKGILEKYLATDNDGNIQYISPEGPRAASAEVLDEFVTKFKAADTDAKKTELFKEYAAVNDDVLSNSLAENTIYFQASKADIETLINNSNLETLCHLNVKDEYKAELNKKAVEKAKELFIEANGQLDNARYLIDIFNKVDESEFTDEEKAGLKTEILETFFTVTTAEDGTKTYTFEPSRRPTLEEIYGLVRRGNSDMLSALVDYIKLEDISCNEYTYEIENSVTAETIVPHYEKFIEGMTEEEVIDFIKNKVSFLSCIPNDKILKKFPDNKEIRKILVENYNENSVISDENRLSLIKTYLSVNEDGNRSFDKEKLPEGIDVTQLIYLLPDNCKEGEAAKTAKDILMGLSLSNQSLTHFLGRVEFILDDEVKQYLETFMSSEDVKNGTYSGNKFIDWCIAHKDDFTIAQKENLYANATHSMKRRMIEGGAVRDAHVLVNKGDTVDKLVMNYMVHHLDVCFPALKKSMDKNPDKWTEPRIREALNCYLQDYRTIILESLRVSDPTKIKVDTILEFDRINWSNNQPDWFRYQIRY